MTENAAGFKSDRKPYTRALYSEYVGKWIRVYTPNGNLEMGKLSKIEAGSLILSPHLGIRSSSKYGPIRKIFYTRLGNNVSLPHVVSVEPSSERDLLNQAEFLNSRQIKAIEKDNGENQRDRN